MIGVTIGIGAAWAALARATAEKMHACTGLRCAVIEEEREIAVCHPSWLKCHLHRMFPDEDSFLYFDADVLPLQMWDPHGLFEDLGRPFCGVPEPNANPELLEECREWGLGYPDIYLNAGLLMFGREHGYVWDRTWTHHPHGGTWLEQTALNHSLALEAVEVCRLPRAFNTLAQKGRLNSLYARATLANSINLHCCAHDDAEAVATMHAQVEAYISSGLAGRTRLDLLAGLPKHSVGAELGVFCGDFSREILRIVQPAQLDLVDLYQGRVTSGNENGQNMRTVDMEVMGRELQGLGWPAVICPCDSVVYLESMIDRGERLDWVYIDTDHEYATLSEELRLAREVVRPGGIIAGHDYSRAFPGVLQAVTEFITRHELAIEIYDGDLLPSYAIRNKS
jgi:hypothetical protein